tara:strand:- start:320 stop:511 length:192 start_codon:yes stop_codon:yes gene_type:complete
MLDLEDLIDFVTDSINNNKDDYLDDEEKFVKDSIEEFLDETNSTLINSLFNDIEDTLYENMKD